MAVQQRSTQLPDGETRSPRVRGLPSSARLAIAFDARTSYDFLISMAMRNSEVADLAAEDRRWLVEARASLPADVRAGIFVGSDDDEGLATEVARILVARPEIATAADLVSAVEDMTPRTLAEALARRVQDEAGAPIEAEVTRALGGDRDALATVEAQLATFLEGRSLLAFRETVRDPVGTAERLHLALRAWIEPFRTVEERVRQIIERDVEARRSDLELPPADLIERTTGGVRFLPDASVRRVVLAPSYFARPYNWVLAGPGWRLFCYPVSDASLEGQGPGEPPPGTLLLFRALGDPQRLRILRLLADRDMYLTEIAQQLDLSKPTVKHHLAQLRAAGLVTVTETGTMTYYTLRRERLDETGVELRRYLS